MRTHIYIYTHTHIHKELKDLYTENNKTPRNETEEDPQKWEDILCSWIRRISIAIMFIYF